MLGNFTFHNPTKLHFGEDSLNKLSEELTHYGKKVTKMAELQENLNGKRPGEKASITYLRKKKSITKTPYPLNGVSEFVLLLYVASDCSLLSI